MYLVLPFGHFLSNAINIGVIKNMRIIDVYEYFKKHPGYNKLIGSDFLFVEYKCPLDIEESQLWTNSHLITYVVNGKKDWLSPNSTYHLTAGDALFVRKGVYTTKQYFEEEYCVMLFFITDNFIKNFIVENDLHQKNLVTTSNQKYLFKIGTNDSFTSLIDSIFHYLKEGNNIPQSLIEIKFKELLFNIALNTENQDLIGFFQAINQHTKADMEQAIMENFKYDLKMEAFAKLCGRSLSSFKRDFKKEFKTTPSRWLTTRRLEYAKTLLLGTELNVNQICFESGFKNPSHFIRAFKNKYNTPPNQFRSVYPKN
jgi:AraC-like DNA-binding protein